MNNQEALDLIIVAFKAAEQLLIPCMVCFDGFLLSHTYMPVEMPGQQEVDRSCLLICLFTLLIPKTRSTSIR